MPWVWLVAGALAMALFASPVVAAERLAYGTAWFAEEGAADDEAAGRFVYYTPSWPGLTLFTTHAGDDEDGRPDSARPLAGAVEFTYEGFGVGGSFLRGSDGFAGRPRDAYGLTGSYRTGRWTIGLSYERFVEQADAGLGVASIVEQGDSYSLGFSYQVGPGVTLGGGVRLEDYQAGAPDSVLPYPSDWPRTILLFGTAIEF